MIHTIFLECEIEYAGKPARATIVYTVDTAEREMFGLRPEPRVVDVQVNGASIIDKYDGVPDVKQQVDCAVMAHVEGRE